MPQIVTTFQIPGLSFSLRCSRAVFVGAKQGVLVVFLGSLVPSSYTGAVNCRAILAVCYVCHPGT